MRPAMCRRSTVFPEPLPPMTTSVSPLKASKDRPRRTSTLSKRFQTSLTSTIAVIRFSSRRPSPLGSLGSQYHFEPFHRSARRPTRLTSHGHSNHFTARLAARRGSPRTATRTISPLRSPPDAAHLARPLEPFHRSARRPTRLTSHGHSNHFTARLAARRGSPRTATRTISPLGSPPDAAHLARPRTATTGPRRR